MLKNRASRSALMEACQAMARSSYLTPGRSGNLSARGSDGDGFVITPSGVAFDRMDAEDMVDMRMDGSAVQGSGRPSSKAKLHLAIYRARPDVGGIVVCQSNFATALSCAEVPIPAFHYMVAIGGGSNIRCAPYGFYDDDDFMAGVVGAMKDRRCCLVAHHGQVATGPTLDEAFELAREFENLCSQFWHTLLLGAPKLLSDGQMTRVLENFGRSKPPEPSVLRKQFD